MLDVSTFSKKNKQLLVSYIREPCFETRKSDLLEDIEYSQASKNVLSVIIQAALHVLEYEEMLRILSHKSIL